MYEMLLTYDDVIDPEVLDDVMTLLSDTNWLVVSLDAVTQYQLFGMYVTHWCVGCTFQGESPWHSADPQESDLWLARTPQAADGCQGNHLTWARLDRIYVRRYKQRTCCVLSRCWTELTLIRSLLSAETRPGFLIICGCKHEVHNMCTVHAQHALRINSLN